MNSKERRKQERESKFSKGISTEKKKPSRTLQDVFKNSGIICNNSVNGGDCYGTSSCLCKINDEYEKYYSGHRPQIEHEEYTCCKMKICQCCYCKCPLCGNYPKNIYNSEDIDEDENK